MKVSIDRLKILLATVVLALTVSLLYFKVDLNTDMLFLEDLSTDLFTRGGRWVDWALSPAPAYVPDMLLYFLAYPLFPDAQWRTFFVSATQVIMLTLTAVWVAKQIYPRLAKGGIAAIILLMAGITLVAAKSRMWLYFHAGNNHFAALLFPLLNIGLFIRFFEKPSFRLAALLVFIGGIAKASTAVYFISFTAPAFLFFLALLLLLRQSTANNRLYKYRLISMLAIVVTAHLCSAFLGKLWTYHQPLKHRIPLTVEGAGKSFTLLLQTIRNGLLSHNHFILIFSWLIVASFLLLLYKLLRSIQLRKNGLEMPFRSASTDVMGWRFTATAAFLAFVLPVNLLGIIVSGGLQDPWGCRYFTFPMALAIILALIVMARGGQNRKWVWNGLYVLNAILLITSSLRFIRKQNSFTFPVNDAVGCLSIIEAEGFALQAGIGHYWDARGVRYHLPNRTPILATHHNLSLHFWMATCGPLLRPNVYPDYKYNFAILRSTPFSEEFGELNYTPDTVGKYLPLPTAIRSFPECEVEVWFYEGPELDAAVKAACSVFLFQKGLTDRLKVFGINLPGETGEKNGLVRIAKADEHQPGFLTCGPYVYLARNKTKKPSYYKVILNYSAQEASAQPVGYVAMGRFEEGKAPVLLYKEPLTTTANGTVTTVLEIPPAGFHQFEVRTWFEGRGELEVQALEIIKLREGSVFADNKSGRPDGFKYESAVLLQR